MEICKRLGLYLFVVFLFLGSVVPGSAQILTTGRLLINGARLEVAPAFQEIDPGRPTVVFTGLSGMPANEVPAGLRVEGELSGPGLGGPLHLSTIPGEPFRIPGLNREGTFTLSGIRLTDGNEILYEAEPNSVEILVHRLVIASVTSRPLSPEEIETYGIVIGEENYTAWHYTVGFQLEGGQVEIPFDFLMGPDGLIPLELPEPTFDPLPGLNTEGPVPTVNIGTLNLSSEDLPEEDEQTLGGGGVVIPGFLIFPTDIAFLNQFFSVILVVQNGALADSGIELKNLSAVLELGNGGVRQAETQPPTIPGEPVTIMDPGPDGVVGTTDDLTFILAQSTGEASWLLEGLEEGQHRLTARMTGELHGLASGEPAFVEGAIPGIVVVRDPRFSMTFFHPWTVRAGEQYTFKVVVANTSTTPVYDFSMTLPGNTVSGAQVLSDEVQSVPELLPGQSAMVTWDMLALATGRVIASGFNTSDPISASFRFEMGVGELGIPLSPESLVLPSVVDLLSETFVEKSLELLGLAYSLATAPNGADVDLPPVGEVIVRVRGAEMATAARRLSFGESLERSMMGLGLKWLGSEVWSSGWDSLRRASRRGHELEAYTAAAVREHLVNVGREMAFTDLEEVLITGRPTMLIYAEGAGFGNAARLRISGLDSGKKAIAQSSDTALFLRDLPGAAVLEVEGGGWSGEIGVVTVPLDDAGQWLESGYRIELLGAGAGEVTLEVLIVMPDGTTRRFYPSMPVGTADGSMALVDIDPTMDHATIEVDFNGDRVVDASETMVVETLTAPEPRVISATFDASLNRPEGGPYDDLILLFSQNTDISAGPSINVEDWVIASHLELTTSDGGTLVSDRERRGAVLARQADPAFLVLSCDTPLNPHAEMSLSTGLSPIPFLGGRALDMIDHPIAAGTGLGSGAVRGVVVGPDGEVVPSAQVSLYENVEICTGTACRWIPILSDRVTADSNGAFLFDSVRFRNGQIPSRFGAFLVRAIDPISGHEAILRAALQSDGAVRDLTLFMVGRGDVVGTLQRADGQPLGSPEVFGRSVTNPEEYATAVLDAFGGFRLTDLPVGAIQVLAVDGQDYVYGTALIPGPGQEGSVDLILPEISQPLAQVIGTVTDGETALAASGMQVYLLPSGSQAVTHMATTDDQGEWAMTDVPSGIVTFKVWDPQRGAWVATVVSELIGDTGNEVDIVTTRSVTGSVIGTVYRLETGSRTPLAGAYVISDSHARWTITDQDGHYRLDDLVLGSVSLRAVDNATGDSDLRTAQLVTEGQELIVDLDIESGSASGAIEVLVTDRSGVPLEGVSVTVEYFGSGLEGTTGPGGTVVIEGVSPGDHELIARLGRRLGRGQATVHFDGYLAETGIALGGTVSLSVETVADTSGGETVRVLSTVGYRSPGINASGQLKLLPETGEYPCELDDDQICHIENVSDGVGNLIVVARNGFYGETSLSEPLDPSDDGRLLTLNFSAPGSITGRVVTQVEDEAVPVEGAWVQLFVQTESGGMIPQQTITTLADGAFFFDLIPPGSFSLRAYSPLLKGLAIVGGSIQSAQNVEDLELLVRGPGAVEGEVAVCFGGDGAGEVVHLTLERRNIPRPFIDGQTISLLDPKHLELTLDQSGQATFVFTELILGSWDLRVASAVNGGARETVYISEPGRVTTLSEPLCLHPTGSIEGLVSFPETGEGAPSVQVQLFRTGYYGPELLTAETTDENGFYRFSEIPVGSTYLTRAYDAAANRGGASAEVDLCAEDHAGYGDTCVQDAVLDIDLAGLGRIEGSVLQAGGAPISNASLKLQTSVVVNAAGELVQVGREYLAFSDPSGAYAFEGVPQGTVKLTAFDPDSHLYVKRTISMDPVTQPTTILDLVMPETESMTVRVLDPTGQPVDGDPAVVVFKQRSPQYFGEPYGGGTSVTHLIGDQPATIEGVVSGRYETAACVGGCSSYDVGDIFGQIFGSALGGTLSEAMPTPPETQVVDIHLVGRADVNLRVTQGGTPVCGAEVRLDGSGHYGNRTFSTQSGADGTIDTIPALGVGQYTASATLTDGSGNTVGGALTFTIDQAHHGTTLSYDIPVEEAGAAAGLVLDAQGQPAGGALIRMTSPGRNFQSISAADGSFLFAALPVASDYTISIFAAQGAGKYTASGVAITANTVTHLGTLSLDETNPTVNAVSPPNGQQCVDVDTDIVLEFSEMMRHASLTSTRLRLRRESTGVIVTTSISLEDVPVDHGTFTRVTLFPAALADSALYIVDVLQGVEDLGGRNLAFDAHFTFRTRDTSPPSVIGFDPPSDSAGTTPVGPDVQPVVSFSEPVDADSVSSTTILLIDGNNEPVESLTTAERDGFDVRIQPLSALLLDSFFTVEVSGITDTSGNTMPGSASSTFRVRDTEAPTVLLLPPQGANIDGDRWWTFEGSSLVLQAAVSSNDAVSAVVFSVHGVTVGSGTFDPGSGEYRLAMTVPLQVGSIALSVVASDVSGNVSAVATHALEIVDDQAPTGALGVDPVAEILPNHLLQVTVNGTDDFGLTHAFLTLSGAIETTHTLNLSGTDDQASASFRVPPVAVAGTQIVVSGEIEDSLGQRTPLAPEVVVVLADTVQPVTGAIQPAPGEEFISGETVSFAFTLEDDVEITNTNLVVGGEVVALTLGTPQAPGSVWTNTASASWIAPEVTTFETVDWTLTATDRAGNSSELTQQIAVRPLVSPDAPVVTFICPQNGDHVLAGITQIVAFEITDPNDGDLIQSYSIKVNGVPIAENISVDQNSLSTSFDWTPPVEAVSGDSFELMIEARDYAGNVGPGVITETVIGGTVLSGSQTIDATLDGLDLVLTSGTFTVDGLLSPNSLTVLKGAGVITNVGLSLQLDVQEAIRIECGGSIDVTGKGYPTGQAYGESDLSGVVGGSHLGLGGVPYGTQGETYGSVYYPQEKGSGARTTSGDGKAGGGVISIQAASLELNGVMAADGQSGWNGYHRSGAGGSIWLQIVGAVTGNGVIRANGGTVSSYGSGGGGAISIEHGNLSGELDGLTIEAKGGTSGYEGGAGTVYVKGPAAIHGDLIVSNGGVTGPSTVLPSLGSGTVLAGSGGSVLETELQIIPAYFVGQWVEMINSLGALKGTWRVASIDGGTITFEDAVPMPSVVEGDTWQGVYLFDTVSIGGHGELVSEDPIRATNAVIGSGTAGNEWTDLKSPIFVEGTVEVVGRVNAVGIQAGSLHITESGALSHEPNGRLMINVSGGIVVDVGGSIDVTSKGYPTGQAYGESGLDGVVGGNHLGLGGRPWGAQGESYGSVYRPQEKGSGARTTSGDGKAGGGVIDIQAASLELNGVIAADGQSGWTSYHRSGAGGSIWLQIEGAITGDGVIRANGGTVSSYGSGGGGAISIEHGNPSGELVGLTIQAKGGTDGYEGGAGTVYVKGLAMTYGDLIVSNGGVTGQTTVLPALGNGTAGVGSSGSILVTDVTPIPEYFVGHWVEITDPAGVLKGTWRIASIDAGTITFEYADPMPSVNPDDTWQGVYLYDQVTVQNGATMTSVDPVRAPGWDLKRDSVSVVPNLGQPKIDLTQVMVESGLVAGSYRISMIDQAIVDEEGISEIRLSDAWGSVSNRDNRTILWPGKPGSRPSITAIDDHPVVRFGRSLRLPPMPEIQPQGQTLIMPKNESCRHVVTDGSWVVVGDRSVRVFDRTDGTLTAEIAGRAPIVQLATGNDYLVVARDHRLEVIDLQDLERGPTGLDIPPEYRVIDMVADDAGAVVLVERMEDDSTTFGLATFSLSGEIESIDLSVGPRFLQDPSLTLERLLQTDERLYVTTSDSTSEGGSILLSFPSDNLDADPESLWLEGVGAITDSWPEGLIATKGGEIRLLRYDGQWAVAAEWTVEADVLHASALGDRLMLAAEGVVLLYDINDPEHPRLMARLNGVAHRKAVLGEVIVLFSPGASAPAVILEYADAERLNGTPGFRQRSVESDRTAIGGGR